MTKDLEVRLIGAPVPDGEVVVKDLAALATALQELATRVGRDVVNTPGPGRTMRFMEEFAQLRLRSVEAGSTILRFSKGPADKLDVDLEQHERADERFWQVIEAIRADERPEWASDLIAESAARLVTALREAAPRALIGDAAHEAVEIESAAIHAETWTTRRVATGIVMTAKGRLEKVDLRSHEFRVRDDVGHAVDLKHVADDLPAAHLVGQWVLATGEGVLASGQLVALDDVTITRLDDPATRFEDVDVQDLDEILASAPGPDPDGGVDLSEEEFSSFLEAARG
ncbi:hypothetical protein [Nocardioides nitrophenolicus]|uniref:hypothetical protein n=1 Tax=Nocardioides nitrophenolicus TaxID=60489 RepID=UPI00195ED31E|nr:hypothetical protein [Nocardioides nitrophenolicus]MBM7519073.1 hypothetical protein [Nocardioides nitrophenolicus]